MLDARALVIVARQLTSTTEPPPGEVMPLVGYSPYWLVLGITIVAIIVAFYVVVALLTASRPRWSAPGAPERPSVDVVQLQNEAYSRVAEIETASMNGEIDARSAHERLSAVVRDYVAQSTGIPADHMTLSELRRTELIGTARAVAQFYPSVFAPEPQQDLATSIHMAREVLAGWH